MNLQFMFNGSLIQILSPLTLFQLIKAFCSSITGTLATRAVLKGYGVGDETATATAATITWMLKGICEHFIDRLCQIDLTNCYTTFLNCHHKKRVHNAVIRASLLCKSTF